ncbi:LacI family DNA-binding transcriptional regulator [Microbacterium arborescens]
MTEPTRRATLADVAARAGMSKAAVSMILNDRPGSRLSAAAAERVRAAAAELDYRPNPAARILRKGRTRTIGFISDEVTLTRQASGLLGGALEVAKAHDHTVLIAETGGADGAIDEAFETMIDHRVDGILIGLMRARRIALPTTSTDVPIVLVNGVTADGHASVLPDERAAGRAVAERLVRAGHSRIGVVGRLPDAHVRDLSQSATIALRFAGIDAAFAGAGIEPVQIPMLDWQPDLGFDGTVRLLDEHPDVTALLAGNDAVALGAYQALAQAGLRIPDDMSVISFDDEVLAGYQRPGLTTARLPYPEIGALGAEMLLGRRDLSSELVEMPIVERASLGPPRRA